MEKIWDTLFPMIANKKANKILSRQINPQNQLGEEEKPAGILVNIDNSDHICSEVLKEQYENTIKTKEKLEDKAKANIIGITIAISLILGASEIISSVRENTRNVAIPWLVFVLLLVSVIYMVYAGLLAVHMLTDENVVWVVSLDSIASGEEKLRDDYDSCIAQNQRKNIIRNNYVFTSYACIRNSLICLLIILLFITIPVDLSSKDHSNRIKEHLTQPYAFSFTSQAVDYITQNDIRSVVENAIVNALEESGKDECNGIFGAVDTSNKLFIKYEVSGNSIRVLILEPYTTP